MRRCCYFILEGQICQVTKWKSIDSFEYEILNTQVFGIFDIDRMSGARWIKGSDAIKYLFKDEKIH